MTTLYKKVGRRYRPVAEHEEWDSYPAGAHLVVCSPGSTLQRFNVDPDRAGLLAAAEPLRGQIRALVMDLHKMRPTRRPVTLQQAAAWRRFQKAMGGDGCFVEYATICTMRWPVAEAKNSRPDNKAFHVERVTHWMPLPELPGAKGEEK